MLLYSPRWLFLYPGFVLLLVGLGAGAWLSFRPISIGPLNLGINTLLYAAAAVLLGFKAIVFAVFTKLFAICEGLLPADRRLERIFQYITLETGLAVGAVITIAGLAASVLSVTTWGNHHFAPMEPSYLVRIVAPAVTALILGAEVILSSFFLSILGVRRRNQRA